MYKITLVYPGLLRELVGWDLYRRCNEGFASMRESDQELAVKTLRQALLDSSACTSGFRCKVGFGWKDSQPGSQPQALFLRQTDFERERDDSPEPAETWSRWKKANGTPYAAPAAHNVA